jgi:hypothetical protein
MREEHVSLLRLVKEHTSATTSPRAVVGRPCSCHSLHRGVSVPDAPRERTHRLAECSASGGVYAMQSPARETAHEHMVQQHREKTWHQRHLAEVRHPGRKRGWGAPQLRTAGEGQSGGLEHADRTPVW